MKNILYCLFLFCFLFSAACTDNPLFGEKNQFQGKSVLTGKVTLEDETDYSDIFVWLRGFKIHTRTKADGSFSLNLPNPKGLPGGALAWNGEYPLYYYVDNFEIDSFMVSILNGEIKQDQLNVDNNGRVRKDAELKKIIQINIYFSKYWLYDIKSRIRVFTEITPYRGTGCTLQYIGKGDGPRAFFLYNVDHPLTDFEQFSFNDNSQIERYLPFNAQLFQKDSVVVNLEQGYYKALPYFHVIQPGVIPEMLKEIGEKGSANQFNALFLKMPVKVNAEVLKVIHLER